MMTCNGGTSAPLNASIAAETNMYVYHNASGFSHPAGVLTMIGQKHRHLGAVDSPARTSDGVDV